ncbi:hypothetical protein V2P20_04220 [Methylobacter sp. Wu1]|jgi:hypothetical protein|uniref:hypothetical protein n=1 Tax=Methylobacter sp. Wu1 TaxID=3119359 RepID=UPI002F95E56D
MLTSGKTACEISSAAIGMTVMAIGSGVSGGTLTLPAMLAGGAVGYLIGKAVCRIPTLQKAFDRAIGTDDWRALEMAFSDASTRKQAVALIADEVGVDASRAEAIWDVIVAAVKSEPKAIIQSSFFKAATYHPATGSAKHGLAVLNITSSSKV